MSKKQISARLPEELVDSIDKLSENRSNFLARAVLEMIDSPELIEKEIEKKKQERKSLLEKKHEIEMEIEETRDEVRELEDLKTEAKTLKKVRDDIPEGELQSVRDVVRENKYDSDPRAANPEEVIQHNAERLASKYDREKGEIETVLRVTTDL